MPPRPPSRFSNKDRVQETGFAKASVPRGETALTGGRTAGPVDPYAGIKQFFNPFGTPQPGDRTLGTFLAGPMGTQLASTVPGQMNAGDGGGGDGTDVEMSEEDYWDAELRKFFEEMNSPLDFNDPLVQNILTGARTATLSDLANRGIHGGYSENQAQQAYINTAAQLQQQKKGQAMQALGMGSNRNLSKTQQQFEADKYGYENDPARTFGAGIGGTLGSLAGLPFGQSEAFGEAGANIGLGLGGASVPRPRLQWGPPPRRTAGGY